MPSYRLPHPEDSVLDPGARSAGAAFAGLCRERAGVTRTGWDVAGNGAVIEQAQVLTTHNLAVLVADAGCRPASTCRWTAQGPPAGFGGLARGHGPEVARPWSLLLDGLAEPGQSSPFYGWQTRVEDRLRRA